MVVVGVGVGVLSNELLTVNCQMTMMAFHVISLYVKVEAEEMKAVVDILNAVQMMKLVVLMMVN